ncbi:hypothetical protein PI172_2348 [Prevotella intermedia]|uniref:Uncharacterized protein n=1 Tax=Prevotella intermedia TaxID=28131 RepID=A0AAD1BLX7_PREIN|nr:hypothetical protein PI172_2348 [Prevotella intermedia]
MVAVVKNIYSFITFSSPFKRNKMVGIFFQQIVRFNRLSYRR